MTSGRDTPTQVLRDEHRLILEVLDVLAQVLERGEAGGAWDMGAMEECIAFFRLFADACHHGKEEDLLFPELQERGMPRDQGPIAVMLHEHRLGRGFVKQMGDALPGARGGDGEALTTMVNAGRGYINLLRGHILKEDNVLFMMADQLVDEPACRRLCAEYDVVCKRHFEGRTKEQLEELAAGLRSRYGPG